MLRVLPEKLLELRRRQIRHLVRAAHPKHEVRHRDVEKLISQLSIPIRKITEESETQMVQEVHYDNIHYCICLQ